MFNKLFLTGTFIFVLSTALTCMEANDIQALPRPLEQQREDAAAAAGSLIYHLHLMVSELDDQPGQNELAAAKDPITFTQSDVQELWERLINLNHTAQDAVYHYYKAHDLIHAGDIASAKRSLALSYEIIWNIWDSATHHSSMMIKEKTYNDFDKNPYITSDARKAIKRYLLPYKSPLRPIMDSIFLPQRATLNSQTFFEAGFQPVSSVRSNSLAFVVTHPKLPGYVIKAMLDSEVRMKKNRPEWLWFSRRCEASGRIRDIIKESKMKYFSAPQKWLYPLPVNPYPGQDIPGYSRKLVVLIAENMNILSYQESVEAWKTKITQDHLQELYQIITFAGGMSYRPDNIPLTASGKFAFIDTEYPHILPHYNTIRPYLSEEMKAYWDLLVRKGGKK